LSKASYCFLNYFFQELSGWFMEQSVKNNKLLDNVMKLRKEDFQFAGIVIAVLGLLIVVGSPSPTFVPQVNTGGFGGIIAFIGLIVFYYGVRKS
jgi:hypothetical protein